MRRLKDYCRFVAWQTGLGYLLLWAVTLWALDHGATVFGQSGVCYPDEAKVLFYWVCDATSPLTILASVVNVALTATVWAPVYLAAATAQHDAVIIAVPIILLHVVGLPLGIFVLIRMMTTAFDLRRRVGSGRGPLVQPSGIGAGALPPAMLSAAPATAASAPAPLPARPTAPRKPAKRIPPRSEFGLRSRGSL